MANPSYEDLIGKLEELRAEQARGNELAAAQTAQLESIKGQLVEIAGLLKVQPTELLPTNPPQPAPPPAPIQPPMPTAPGAGPTGGVVGSIADEIMKMNEKSEYTNDAELIAWGAAVGVHFQPNDKKPGGQPWCGYGAGIGAKYAGYTIPDSFPNSQAWLGFGAPVERADIRKDDIVVYKFKFKDGGHVAVCLGDQDGDGEVDVVHCNMSNKVRVTGIDDHCEWCQSEIVGIRRLAVA